MPIGSLIQSAILDVLEDDEFCLNDEENYLIFDNDDGKYYDFKSENEKED
ncbi:15087_t:CDS:2 [Entrophospora sp. SA101]|nr:10040_t:CDS:2 [Entrophospora sp. SA101]CAJ0651699.1 13336_t:CDS:2 [Entrophospora sp. SA101]CAJ0753691.1 15087_t:CDS:2 [Entrophospora sp. SA101]CAJ0827902.1 53_t:CDS:2 [Entrophospora sp. SA101]CAJ0833694.1 11856_t:CDS:2 [Entrophospora sp. SA101]